jgi:hypothetical protein
MVRLAGVPKIVSLKRKIGMSEYSDWFCDLIYSMAKLQPRHGGNGHQSIYTKILPSPSTRSCEDAIL